MSARPTHQIDWLARLQMALPVVVAGSLAAFTWWLVSSSPDKPKPARSTVVRGQPDYVLSNARLARFDVQGRLNTVLDGKTMRHYVEENALQVDDMLMSARNEDGRRMQAVAERGEWIDSTGIVTLNGGADVRLLPAPGSADSDTRNRPTRVEGEGLKLDTRARILSSTLPVKMTQDHSEVRAQSMQHDEGQGLTLLGGRVHGRLDSVGR